MTRCQPAMCRGRDSDMCSLPTTAAVGLAAGADPGAWGDDVAGGHGSAPDRADRDTEGTRS